LEILKVKLADLKQAPWRFSDDRSRGIAGKRKRVPILENIVRSLIDDGQFGPIHVRPLDGSYEIIDGHIVVDAARKLGWTELDAVVHEGLDDEKAYLRYVHMNLNRCGQYGHYHVKIYRTVRNIIPPPPINPNAGELELDAERAQYRAKVLYNHMSWPQDRVLDYCELQERDHNWQKWMYFPKDTDDKDPFADDEPPTPVSDYL
jgi:ParB-like nuclease family protein